MKVIENLQGATKINTQDWANYNVNILHYILWDYKIQL